jgi:hypothetical protein
LLAIIAILQLVIWQHPRIAAASATTTAGLPVPDWEYEIFEWHEMEFDRDGHPGQVYSTFLHMDGDEGTWGKEGREELALDSLLLGWKPSDN